MLTLIAGLTAVSLTLGLVPEEKAIGAAFSAAAFNFMYELILSRNVTQYAMCPVIDLFNHDSTIDAEVSYDYFKDSYSVLSGRTFKPGDQVFISYGRQTTDSLLQYYGFVAEDNVDDLFTFPDFIALLRAASVDVLEDRVVELLRSTDVTVRDALAVVRLTNKSQVEDQVKAALRYVLGVADTLTNADEKVSNAKDAVIWSAILAVCKREYAAYPTTLAQEEKALKDSGRAISDRRRMIFQYNITKKRFLLERIEQLQVRVQKMSGSA